MRNLPAGIVTFCFTDIEESTRLLRDLGERYHDVLAEHRRLLTDSFTGHGGEVVSAAGGDSLFVVFSDAADALHACAVGQLALASYEWPSGSTVKVRLGLHTGEAQPDGGDYIALAVNQASRVADAAHGGQVLVSAATAAAAGGAVPAGWHLRDVGRYRLKGFDEPARLFEMAHGDGPQFPLPRARAAVASNLPSARGSFVARAELLREVGDALRDSRVVTLVGPGGVGKTRTAIETATAAATNYPDGVLFVDLAPLTDESRVVAAFAEVAPRSPGDSDAGEPLEALADRLRGRHLVVVDNCEHLVDEAACVIDALTDRCKDLTILATSRMRLRLPQEQVLHLDPLAVPDEAEASAVDRLLTVAAVQLFVARAARARRGFEVTAANAAAVASIVRKLDGMPLAIELAAARLAEYEPAAVDRALDRGVGLLGGGRTVAQRHQSLEAAMRWSYDLLDGEAQRVFRSLALFADWFAADAVARVAGTDVGTEIMTAFAEHSLVTVDRRPATPRFRLLATLRAFAAERLTADLHEQELVALAHFEWAAMVASDANDEFDVGSGEGFDARLDQYHADLAAALARAPSNATDERALQLALALARSDEHRADDAYETLAATVDASREASPMLQAQALRTLGVLAWRAGAYRDADAQSQEALGRARELGDLDLEARCLNNLGATATSQGDFTVAKRWFEQSLEIAQLLGNTNLEAYCQNHLGMAARLTGEWGEALERLERALALARSTGDVSLEAAVLPRLGGLAWAIGDYDRAAAFDEEGLELARRTSRPRLELHCLLNLGYVAWAEQDFEASLSWMERARGCAEAFDLPVSPDLDLGVARNERGLGNFGLSAQALRSVLEWSLAQSHRGVLVEAVEEAALLATTAGHDQAAAELAGAAATLRAALGKAMERRHQEEHDQMLLRLGAIRPAAARLEDIGLRALELAKELESSAPATP